MSVLLNFKTKPVFSVKVRPRDEVVKEIRGNVARRNRSKGKRSETELGLTFSNWWNIPESFFRTASSGAGRKLGQAGDLACPHEFRLVVENKNSEAWTLTTILTKTTVRSNKLNIFWQYWEQAVEATDIYNSKRPDVYPVRYPALIFTKPYEEAFIMLESRVYFNLNLNLPEYNIKLTHAEAFYYICTLDNFLSINPPELLGKK